MRPETELKMDQQENRRESSDTAVVLRVRSKALGRDKEESAYFARVIFFKFRVQPS
jgi:hypothetical protein